MQFLQGCTKGRHNPVKPVEPVRVREKPLEKGEVSLRMSDKTAHENDNGVVTMACHDREMSELFVAVGDISNCSFST